MKGELLMLLWSSCSICGCVFEECECAERASLFILIL